jgi:multisubunit Na+/H+ antiporter MnhG subunit
MNIFLEVWIIFVSTVLLHGLLGRIGRPRNSILRYLSVWGAGNLVLMVWFWEQEVCGIELLAGFALFAFFGELYVFLFTFVISSVSAAILMKSSSLKNAFPDEEPKKMVEKRIATLVRVGLLRISTKGQELTSRGRCVLKIYQTLRILFGHGKVGNSY